MARGRIRLGMLTPSSNTVLEPMTGRLLSGMEGVTAHFSRFPVTEIALHAAACQQFDLTPMLAAARLLKDAKVHAISWNGTSASWLGLEADRQLCTAIKRETGLTASSCVLSLVDIFAQAGVRRFGLVTPYTGDVQQRIADNFRAQGFACVAERHLGIRDNFAFGEVDCGTIARMVREVALRAPDAIAILCTNLAGALVAEALEPELGIPVHDSVASTLWGALSAAGLDLPVDATSSPQLTHFPYRSTYKERRPQCIAPT